MIDDAQIQIDEYTLVEKPALDFLHKLGYTVIEGRRLQREPQHFFLLDVLTGKLKELNPWLDDVNLKKLVHRITHIQAPSAVEANQEFYYNLVNYLSIKQDVGKGKKSQTVKLVDFDHPEKNEFTAVRQFYVKNSDFSIIPDIVLFVNGIPLAVIECKSPNIEDPIGDAISQLLGYREKNEQFFYPNQIIVGLARFKAMYAATYAPSKYFFDWKTSYPATEDELQKLVGREHVTPQDTLLYSLFNPENFLDIIRSYVVFEEDDNKIIKKVCRYNQYIASNRIIERIGEGKGGVVWHTQGSGKSLTMTFTALKMRRMQRIPRTNIENPCILIVTDRTDLDDQISSTFKNCGFPNPIPVESVEQLKEELSNPQGKTLFTTIQKFQSTKGATYPKLTDSNQIIVYADEGHRSQYKDLALNMHTGIPKATFIAFTGTPIDKKDKSTPKVFGTYIDKYLPRQSIADGATVEIKYQARLERVHFPSSELDVKTDEELAEYSDKEKETIKKKYGRYRVIAEDDKRIHDICVDLIAHYRQGIQPEGFKAQIVTFTRDAAITYKKTLDALGAPRSEVIISKNPKDDPKGELTKYYTTKTQQRKLIKEFKKPLAGKKDDLCLLIVCDMLITGFDAPIEQVMYLDKPLREHTLMQAVARVNRPYTENKTHGLIIDYCGISKRLKEALDIFNDGDIQGFLQPLTDDVPRAEQARNKLERFFQAVPKTGNSEAFVDACVLDVLNAQDARIRFEKAFKEFVIYVNNLMPNPEANQFKKDLHLYGKIYNSMRTNYDIREVSVLDAAQKIKRLIHDYLETEGIRVLHDPVSIYSTEFADIVEHKRNAKAKASLIEHKVRTTISNLLPTNPVYFTSLRERLERIIADKTKEMEDTTQLLTHLNELKDDLDVDKVAHKQGLTKEEFAVYELLRTNYLTTGETKNVRLTKEEHETLTNGAKALYKELAEQAVIDWKQKPEHQKGMLRNIKRSLYRLNVDVETAEQLGTTILNLARNIL